VGGAELFQHPAVAAFERTQLDHAAIGDAADAVDGPLDPRIAKQRETIQEFDKGIEEVARQQKAAEVAIAADDKAIFATETGRW